MNVLKASNLLSIIYARFDYWFLIFLISLNEKYAPIKVSENDRLDIFGKVLGKSDASAITGHCR